MRNLQDSRFFTRENIKIRFFGHQNLDSKFQVQEQLNDCNEVSLTPIITILIIDTKMKNKNNRMHCTLLRVFHMEHVVVEYFMNDCTSCSHHNSIIFYQDNQKNMGITPKFSTQHDFESVKQRRSVNYRCTCCYLEALIIIQ